MNDSSPKNENESIDDFFSRQREALSAGDSEERKRWYVEEFQRREGARSKRTNPWRYLGYVILALLAFYFIFTPWQEGFWHLDMMSFLFVPFLLSVVWLVAVVGFMVARKELKCPKCHREVSKPVKGLCAHCAVKLLPDAPTGRWYRVSLRTVVVFVMAAAVPCSWLGARLHRAHEHRQAIAEFLQLEAEIGKVGGHFGVMEVRPDRLGALLGDPGWLEAWDFRVVDNSKFDDDGLVHLRELWTLRSVDLSGTQVTDTGLKHLVRLSILHDLYLHNTQVTDKGVERLQEALPRCRIHR